MLTVVFATYNGAETLPLMLPSLTRLEAPDGGWKLIAVDNGSTDQTSEILSSYQDKLPIKILNQPQRGKNRALNTAIPHFEGDLVVFTDDDIIADPRWLIEMRRASDSCQEFDIFGGSIIPHWPEPPPPSWLLQNIPTRAVYAHTGDDLSEGPVNPGRIIGPNMAVRKRVFDAGHRFNDRVGPTKGQYRMGSESEFTLRIYRLGYRPWHVQKSLVCHIIQSYQLDPRWILKRGYRFGRGMFWIDFDPKLRTSIEESSHESKTVLGLPRWIYRAIVEAQLLALIFRIHHDEGRLLRARWDVSFWSGYIYEGILNRSTVKSIKPSRSGPSSMK
ncbi:MAG: glycosyltransferase family 2 protein [Rhodospirillales bacterium]|nr:MAG: glycosyltransferase family 2 protein [Rhodospirillales bacterium]